LLLSCCLCTYCIIYNQINLSPFIWWSSTVFKFNFQPLASLGSQNWQVYLNLLSSESNQHQSSPSNINAQSIRVWSYEQKRTWSPKMNSLDILATSSHYFYRKCMEAGMENLNFDTSWVRGLRDLYLFIYLLGAVAMREGLLYKIMGLIHFRNSSRWIFFRYNLSTKQPEKCWHINAVVMIFWDRDPLWFGLTFQRC